jgi:hypothetical protein
MNAKLHGAYLINTVPNTSRPKVVDDLQTQVS